MNKTRFLSSITKSLIAISNALPIIVGILLLTSMLINLIAFEAVSKWFGQQGFIDVLIGVSFGSIAVGQLLASYLLGGKLLAAGVSLLAVTALIVSWVTVGIVQLPAKILLLGKQFAIYRNLMSFVFAQAVVFLWFIHCNCWVN